MKQLSLIRVDVQEKFTHRINHFLMRLLRHKVKKENTTNPEQLFAAAYSACFNGALELVMDQEKVEGKSTVTARISLFQGEDGFSVGAELEVHIDGVDQAKAEELVKKAHEICPYSKATRNNIDVKLTVI